MMERKAELGGIEKVANIKFLSDGGYSGAEELVGKVAQAIMQDGMWYISGKELNEVIEKENVFYSELVYPFTSDEVEVLPRVSQKAPESVKPDHYKLDGISTVEVIERATAHLEGVEAFCAGNVIKYITRYSRKNGLGDLQKAKQYIDIMIDNLGR